jgi:hypothetical protein
MRSPSNVICIVLIGLAVACSQPPSGPSNDGCSLPSQPIPQRLDLTGFDISFDPDFPVCSNIGSPRSGKHVVTSVLLEQTGCEYIARSTAPDTTGTLELRFRRTGEFAMGGETIVGTMTGSARDVTNSDVRIDIAGTAQVSGRVNSLRLTFGRVSGTMTFADGAGVGGTCTAVTLYMSPESLVQMPLTR